MNGSNSKDCILVIEDERSIAESLEYVLKNEGFSPHWENLASSGLEYLAQNDVSLVIMDIGLPDMTGLEACKKLRLFSNVPVMFLTARDEEIDRIIGLEIGGDDYVTKPFSPREVAARVKAILKRTQVIETAQNSPHQSPTEIKIDPARKEAYYCQQPLKLTKLEYKIVCTLTAQPNRVYNREQLLDAIGVPTEKNYERSIDSHIKCIRAKLSQINPTLMPIKTQRGFGYYYQVEG